ncbi:alpha/beta fold hydrolase [Gemmatimonas sp.]|uniref:alpha/beta hydrolase n=1 Tax=Gemmatimonas sp. TaxID=1962908 RepID=UPI00286E33DA|nr:alpha/beta fold hydrolase [Gemmatimonas sp.]
MTTLSLVHAVRPPEAGANVDGVKPPLLILMHGVGSNEHAMAQLAPAFDPRFVVVSVRSPLTLGLNAFGWFHVSFTAAGPVIVAEEAEAGWTLLAQFIDEAVSAYDVDPTRVFLAGFSQGGIMALATLLTAPEKVAGAVMMSGRLLPEVLPHTAAGDALRDKPALIVHGTGDEKLDIHLARWAREQLAQFPLALTYRELPMAHAITEDSLAVATTWLASSLDAAHSTAHSRTQP